MLFYVLAHRQPNHLVRVDWNRLGFLPHLQKLFKCLPVRRATRPESGCNQPLNIPCRLCHLDTVRRCGTIGYRGYKNQTTILLADSCTPSYSVGMNNNGTIGIATTTGLDFFHPEMGETRAADAVIDASLSHDGKHYYLTTSLVLTGRGVVMLKTLTANDLVPQARHKIGWHDYKVTEKAFDAICKQYKVSYEMLLD